MVYELSQVLVVFGEACLLSSFYFKEKLKELIFVIVACVLMATHYFLLNAITGGIISIITALLFLVDFFMEKKSINKNNVYKIITFDALFIVFGLIGYSSWISILPILALVMLNTLYIFKNDYVNFSAIIFQSICFIFYNFLVASYTAFATQIITLICTIVMLIVSIKSKKHLKNAISNNQNLGSKKEEIENLQENNSSENKIQNEYEKSNKNSIKSKNKKSK